MTPGAGLDAAAGALLSEAMRVYRDSRRSTVWLRHHLNRLDEPLRLAVTGPWRAGKSTLVNALVGEDVAPVEVDGVPPVFTWYQDGPAPRATLCPAQGPAYDLPVTRSGRGLRVAPAGWAGGDVDEVVVEWPTRALRRTHLIDTPPLGADGEAEGSRTADRVLREADAVLYLTPHLGEDDLAFLRLGLDGRVAAAAPVHVLAVLTRADETAGGRIDALVAAKQSARRRRREPRVAALVPDVLAVSPLLAHAGRTLTSDEFMAIGSLAAVPRPDLEPHLLSTDRFTAAAVPAPVAVEVRRDLLRRFGLFGVRLAATLVRTGCHTRAELADRLVRHSGLAELQESVAELFVARRSALKARSALLALEWVLRSEPLPAAVYLAAELERLVSGAHDFRELRLLADLRTRRVSLPADLVDEARRLVGGYGTDARDRLGLAQDAADDDVWAYARAAVERWRAVPAEREFTADQRRAAEVVVRSCEGVLAATG
jgi:hypothetical protein